jgi:hypothetical protein
MIHVNGNTTLFFSLTDVSQCSENLCTLSVTSSCCQSHCHLFEFKKRINRFKCYLCKWPQYKNILALLGSDAIAFWSRRSACTFKTLQQHDFFFNTKVLMKNRNDYFDCTWSRSRNASCVGRPEAWFIKEIATFKSEAIAVNKHFKSWTWEYQNDSNKKKQVPNVETGKTVLTIQENL